ncbi:MAG: DUF423 domain-containing protein [Verrucomicrobia bacterium]|nr:DUF423 domain-containing protein [Verrucomicrobiota bacterium]
MAVTLGAFGAHALKDTLENSQHLETWKTAAQYHLVHSVAVLAVALAGAGFRRSAYCWLAGMILFSGSLYLLSVTGLKWLGAITPFGGLFLLAGWATLLLPAKSAD